MGGSGNGPIQWNRTPDQVERRLREEEEKALQTEFETRLSGFLNDLLSTFNERDHALARERINELKSHIETQTDETIDTLFGGSVAKHTYVNGLSDIDTLFVLKETAPVNDSPRKLVSDFAQLIKTKLGSAAEVEAGRMAVTITYKDGMELQVLPAIRNTDGTLKICSLNADRWSRISPKTFQEALTSANQACGGKLVPTIKLAKAINATLPEGQQLTGYHIEALAVDGFQNYTGGTKPRDMLVQFYSAAKEQIKHPLTDVTKQSNQVDEYLGQSESAERIKRAHVLERIEKRMRLATTGQSIGNWRALFGLDDE